MHHTLFVMQYDLVVVHHECIQTYGLNLEKGMPAVRSQMLSPVPKHNFPVIWMQISKDRQEAQDGLLFPTAQLGVLWRQCCAKVLVDVMQSLIEANVPLCTCAYCCEFKQADIHSRIQHEHSSCSQKLLLHCRCSNASSHQPTVGCQNPAAGAAYG